MPLYGLCFVILTYTARLCLSRSFRLKPPVLTGAGGRCPQPWPLTPADTHCFIFSVLTFPLLLVTGIRVPSLSSLLGWDVLWKGCLPCAQGLAHRRDWSAYEKNRWSKSGLFPSPFKVHGHQAYPLQGACFTKSPKKWSYDPAQSLPFWQGLITPRAHFQLTSPRW